MEIIPAILPKDFNDLETCIESVRGFAPVVQVDICDGRFVSSFSWPYKKHDTNFEEILREDRGMPAWEDVDYEIDLMVTNPEDDIARWVAAGAARVVIHIESTKHFDKVLENATELVEIGIAVSIDTPMAAVDELISTYGNRIRFIQCMGIDRIGFQGQTFDPKVLDKIREVRAKYPEMIISVDGGVNHDSALLLKEAGANRLIIGSSIFNEENIPEAIHTFQNI
ncbi:MAG: ribulose-phosphate 3-epimerase, ribulose-phosphate 3-epimerase [Candidatus Taylorbacteria bacterium]|nr:ribulose-phosphate 3-epimerase, ribulose-phosphate 3-epimerase [Candidatus Taylorbacteria bacterium]